MIKKMLKKNQGIVKLHRAGEFTYRRFLSLVSPKASSKRMYKKMFGKPLNLKKPKTLNEKLMWLKLNTYNNNPLITLCVDKYKVREYIERKGLSHTLNKFAGEGVYDTVDEIQWSNLPNKFVIKCNHGSGYNLVCEDKRYFNVEEAKDKLKKWMKEDYYLNFAEIQYKHVPKKIICEEYLGDNLTDYKFFCFNGEPKFLYVSSGLGVKTDMTIDFYDLDWKRLDFKRGGYGNSLTIASRPSNFEEMINISKILSRDFPFVRVDLFNINDKIYFSELTFIPTGGLMRFNPSEMDAKLGDLLDLSNYLNFKN